MPEYRYEIKYGPDGEQDYAWVYRGAEMVATMRTHHAANLCNSRRDPKPRDGHAAEPEHAYVPWEVDYGTGDILAPGRRVAATQSGGVFNLHDARLIAAAPEMLSSLKFVLGHPGNILTPTTRNDIEMSVAKAEGRPHE